MTWIDEIWKHKPGTPVIGSRTGLTQLEKRALLGFAQGNDNGAVAAMLKETPDTFKNGTMTRLRGKLHADDVRRLVKLGYLTGALELSYEGAPPSGVEVPEEYLEVQLLIADGLNNEEIGAKLGISVGVVRSKVLRLGRAFAVVRGIGGRTQLASRCFEFGILPGAYAAAPKKGS